MESGGEKEVEMKRMECELWSAADNGIRWEKKVELWHQIREMWCTDGNSLVYYYCRSEKLLFASHPVKKRLYVNTIKPPIVQRQRMRGTTFSIRI